MDDLIGTAINLVADLFGGSTTLAGLAILVGAWFVCLAILASLKAPPEYSVVPMIPITIMMMGYGLMSIDVAMIIIFISCVITASGIRKIITS